MLETKSSKPMWGGKAKGMGAAQWLNALVTESARERWSGFERLLSSIWMLEPERDDEAWINEETARAVPLLIELLRSSASGLDDCGRAALLLGLIAEARGVTASVAAECRTELRKGIPTYLEALAGTDLTRAGNEALVAALLYLLAHFPEDKRVILDALSHRIDDQHPAFAQMRRVFDPPSTLLRIGSIEELTTSALAEMGARAEAALPVPGISRHQGAGTDPIRGPLDVAPTTPSEPSAVGLAQRLMEDRALVKLYESHIRPQVLRVMGGNWAGHLTPEDEDAYILQAPAPARGPVLDLACGAGRCTRVVAKKVGAERVIGLDLSWPMLVESEEMLPEVFFVRGNALQLPFAGGTLGGVNCFNALQVLPDPEKVIQELGRCMRRDAVFTCFSFRRAPRGVYRYFQSRFERSAKIQAFSEEDVRRWLANAGMTAIDFSGPNLCLFFTARKN
jgi:SAM-dependent methyltransferase